MSNSSQPGMRTAPPLNSLGDRVEIAPGVFMPRLGVGTSNVTGSSAVAAELDAALELGYRLVDTATSYHNEAEIGAVLASAGLPRSALFVTSKVWPDDQGFEPTLRAFELSRSKLRMDYLDLYLIHWPEPSLTADTWLALETLLARGDVRAIGVSNFTRADFEQLAQTARVCPAIDQIEFHPYLQRRALVTYCESLGVTVQAWSPLMRGRVGQVPLLGEIGERRGKSAAQVTLRWILQRGLTTMPKSVHRERLAENADIFDFALSGEEMAAIDALDRGEM